MSGKQAKTLAANHIDDLLLFAETTRHPARDRVIVLLSVKAGLRAAEIANLTWEMVLDPEGGVSTLLELRDGAAKMGHGRVIPLHSDLRDALTALNEAANGGLPVVLSERGSKMKARSIVI
jgi:integrase